MDFKQTLINEVQAETAARMNAINAATGRINEAEMLAASLQEAGLDCIVSGFSSSRHGVISAHLTLWIYAYRSNPIEQLIAAIRRGEITVSRIVPQASGGAEIYFAGFETPLHVDHFPADDIQTALLTQPTSALSIPDDMALVEIQSIAARADLYLISDGKEVKVSPHILPGWHEVPISIAQDLSGGEPVPGMSCVVQGLPLPGGNVVSINRDRVREQFDAESA